MARSFALMVVCALAAASSASAEGISFPMLEAPANPSFDSSFGAPSPFVASSTTGSTGSTSSTSSRAAIAAPPASLLAPSSAGTGRTNAFGGLSTMQSESLTNPLGHLTGTTSSVLSAPDRYESGAASRITALPSTSGSIMKQFTIPTTTMGAGQGVPSAVVQPMPFAPTSTIYFGGR
jgi:hypothetical protein